MELHLNIQEIILEKYLFKDSSTEENKIQEFMEEIFSKNESFIKNNFRRNNSTNIWILFNGFFMKYTDKINKIIIYGILDKNICQNIFKKNYLSLNIT